MRVACSGCRVHMKGDPADTEVSHGACSRECFEFHGALKEFGAELRDPHPNVAQFAVRLPSETEPGATYEVALIVDYRETEDEDGNKVDAPSGGLSWACECRRFVLGGAACKHIPKAIHLRTLQRRMQAYQAALRAAS